MQTSARGIAFLELHEGVVLKAYRDPVGIWTIGAGLTKASGVIDPKPGMRITRLQASDLLRNALNRNYEPSVARAMPGANQHEFDGGVSFHWNTGAIGRASWVRKWARGDWAGVAAKIKLWRKGGGRVLPGLVRRRDEELRMIRDGVYVGVGAPAAQPGIGLARIVSPLSSGEIADVREGFFSLGYDVGPDAMGIARDAVVRFQADHDLTVDGIVGRATLSTLQRRLDAPQKMGAPSGTALGGAAGTQAEGAALLPTDGLLAAIGTGIAVIGLLWLLWRAWQYRDVLAAKVQDVLPGVASALRSV